MPLAETYATILKRLPSVARPVQRLTFKEKLKWTAAILLIYVVLAQIQVYGVSAQSSQQLRIFEILLGSSFGTIMSLGIGPIVTSSIILQLMVGSKLIQWDLTTEKGKVMFQGTQKVLAVFFSFLEAAIFVNLGTIPATPGLQSIVILQLALGGILVIFMDEVVAKWGFGSGVGLFIVAGVAKQIFVRTFNPLTQACNVGGFDPALCWPTPPTTMPAGQIPQFITFLALQDPLQAFKALLPLMATILVFFLVVYISNMKVEIPLAFGNIRGFGRRWPLKFLYTSNIPVILVAALLANVQIMGSMLAQQGSSIIGATSPETGQAVPNTLLYYITPPTAVGIAGIAIAAMLFALLGVVAATAILRKPVWLVSLVFALAGMVLWIAATGQLADELNIIQSFFILTPEIARTFTYAAFMIGGSVLFAYFWMHSAGMDSKSVANQIHNIGMQIPGYRRDIRIIEMVLNRYIPGLTVLGGAAVGALAAFADTTNAIGSGTGILLAVTIVYQLYEELANQHLEDMHPALRKFMQK